MATLWISEFDRTGINDGGNQEQLAKQPSVTTQAVTYNTSTASTAFNTATKLIRVIADATVHLEFGAAPTATSSSLYLPSGQVEYFAVDPGDKVAAYDGTS